MPCYPLPCYPLPCDPLPCDPLPCDPLPCEKGFVMSNANQDAGFWAAWPGIKPGAKRHAGPEERR